MADDLDQTLQCVVNCVRDDPEAGLDLSMHPIVDIEVGHFFRDGDGRLWQAIHEDVEADEVQLELVNGDEKAGFLRAGLSKKVVDGPWEKVYVLPAERIGIIEHPLTGDDVEVFRQPSGTYAYRGSGEETGPFTMDHPVTGEEIDVHPA